MIYLLSGLAMALLLSIAIVDIINIIKSNKKTKL